MTQEIELKLNLPSSAVARLRRHPLFAEAPKAAPTRTLLNTYFDTPDLRLKAHRVALRTRKQGRDWLQTVKCGGELVGGLAQRPEWEFPYRGDFVFEPISAPAVQALLEDLRPALTPIFTTHFRRETRRYAPREGVTILMMLDLGTVEAQGRRAPLCELELELVEGPVAAVFDLALALAADLPLLPDDVSKAQRGYRLFLAQAASPVRAADPVLAPGDPPLLAFRRLALASLAHWQANIHGALLGEDPEFVHQMRVALRRLRSLLRVMAPILPPGFFATWNPRLGEATQTLGATRDLDVLVDTLLPAVPLAGGAPVASLTTLSQHAARARQMARRAHQHDVDRGLQGRCLLGFAAALHSLTDSTGAGTEALPELALRQLRRLRKQAARRLKVVMTDGSANALHALRIAVKRLRYGFEFFHPLLARPKAVSQFIAALARFQDELGYHHDVTQAALTLQTWSARHRALVQGAAFVAGWHGANAARIARRLPARLDRLLRSQAARPRTRRS